ncbi:MAG: RsiV family protein [Xanthobacteraceae bacterium]
MIEFAAGRGKAAFALAAVMSGALALLPQDLAPQIFGSSALSASPQIAIEKKYVEVSVIVDPALKPFSGLFSNCLAEGKAWADKMAGAAAAEWKDDPKSFRGLQWNYDRGYTLRSVVGRYVSVVRGDDTFEGGAHPNQEIDTILWDNVAQKRVSVRPFFNETADNGPTMTTLAELARLAVATAKLAKGINGYGDDDTPAATMTPEQELQNDSFIKDGIKPALLELGPVTLAPSTEGGKSAGLTFHYSPYGVGPYVEGPYTVFVPWMSFRRYLSADGAAIFAGTRPKSDEDQ